MPKIKTKSSAKKRFRITASGKVKRSQACHSHKATSKTPKRRRNLRKSRLVSEVETKRIKRLLPYK
jgi:large subunit ribosomal protein L35